jgi:hypothetical protein
LKRIVLDALLILSAGRSTNALHSYSAVVVQLTGPLHFPQAPKWGNVHWQDWGGVLKTCQGHRSIADFQHNMETVSHRSEMCTND